MHTTTKTKEYVRTMEKMVDQADARKNQRAKAIAETVLGNDDLVAFLKRELDIALEIEQERRDATNAAGLCRYLLSCNPELESES
mgnify:CR=1 FL=1